MPQTMTIFTDRAHRARTEQSMREAVGRIVPIKLETGGVERVLPPASRDKRLEHLDRVLKNAIMFEDQNTPALCVTTLRYLAQAATILADEMEGGATRA